MKKRLIVSCCTNGRMMRRTCSEQTTYPGLTRALRARDQAQEGTYCRDELSDVLDRRIATYNGHQFVTLSESTMAEGTLCHVLMIRVCDVRRFSRRTAAGVLSE